MKPLVKVSKKQKEEIDFKNEIIQRFFDRFVKYSETRYMSWIDNLRIGDVVDYMMASVIKGMARKRKPRY